MSFIEIPNLSCVGFVPGEDASLHSGGSLSPTSDNVANELQGLSLEEQERQKAEWSAELAKVNLSQVNRKSERSRTKV